MNLKLTASDIIHAIGQLPKDQSYNYVNETTSSKIKIKDIVYPEGPISIQRYDPRKQKVLSNAMTTSISTEMIWRVANAFVPNLPINLDRVLGGSYNTRSALEALLAHTPEFYFCFPGRIEVKNSTPKIKHGHKHLLWRPDMPHEIGKILQTKTEIVISEIPSADAIYDSVKLPDLHGDEALTIDTKRRHAQIQIALMLIGKQLGSKIWIAHNDKAIEYKGVKLGEMQGVIASLNDVQLLKAYEKAITAARMIDVIWFRNSKFMPAVFEIEHSTGVISGLSRMKNFQDAIPRFESRWVIVGPDDLREKVLKESNKEQFNSLKACYFSYSAVEELFSLCQRRKIKGVSDEFLDSFMEPCLN
jgi:type II restriction enzyme